MHNTKHEEERLTKLQEELKAVPAEEREAVYKEMVADGEFNPFAEDDDPHALITQLKEEESDSVSDRIINFLLAFLPLLLLPFIYAFTNIGGGMEMTPFMWSQWITLGIATLLALIGLRRRSDPLTVHWLGIALSPVGLLLFTGFVPIFSQIAVVVVCVVLLGWIGRLIYKNRHNHLFTAFATFPFVSFLASFVVQPMLSRYLDIEQITSTFAVSSAVSMALTGIGLGLFFIARQRGTKWFGVFSLALSAIVSNLVLMVVGLSSFPLSVILLFSLVSLFMVGVPAFFFWRDGRPKEKQPEDMVVTEPNPL